MSESLHAITIRGIPWTNDVADICLWCEECGDFMGEWTVRLLGYPTPEEIAEAVAYHRETGFWSTPVAIA